MPVSILTIVLLTISNIFMTFPWHGRPKFKEHCFAVPASRRGSAVCSTAELKAIREISALSRLRCLRLLRSTR